ncbi:MAG: leucine-rich repeat protein, partial [Lachnospiraceae bacterium]|nr:leucine-rich repeat protein [Lachnospiraceae bacterium]
MRKLAALLVVAMATLNISTTALGAEVEEVKEGIETPVETASNEEIEAGRPEESPNLQSSSGKCGTWLDYTIDDDNKLVITGKLEMTSAPWTWKSTYNEYYRNWHDGWSGDLWNTDHYVYTGKTISSVIFTDELTTICDYAFTRDTEKDRNHGAAISVVTPILNQNLTLPARLLSIGTEAFYESEIKNITFNDQLKTIGDRAFEYCSNLKGDIKIPKSVESIGVYAFAYLKNNEGQLSFENGSNLKEIKAGTFRECAFTGRVEFPEGLETIGSNAFTEDAFITELYIPATVTSIAADAFDKTDIKKIDYEGSEAAWKKLGFDKVEGFKDVGVDFGNSNMTCTVSFNTGFDDITVPSQTVDFDKYITKPEVKKIGYRLDGWYKDKEFNQ